MPTLAPAGARAGGLGRAIIVCGLREDRTGSPVIRTRLALVAWAGGGHSAELLRTEQSPCLRECCSPGGVRSRVTSLSSPDDHIQGVWGGRDGIGCRANWPLLSTLGLQRGLGVALSKQPLSGRNRPCGRRLSSAGC